MPANSTDKKNESTQEKGYSGVSFLDVPLTAKQDLLPYKFSSIKNSELTEIYGYDIYDDFEKKQPFLFSFKNSSNETLPNLKINFCPNSFKNFFSDGDISYKLLFRSQFRNSENKKDIDFNNFLDTIPCIQIREYQQTSKLSIVSDIFKNLYEGFTSAEKDKNVAFGDIMKHFYDQLKTLFTGTTLSEVISKAWTTTVNSNSGAFPSFLNDSSILMKSIAENTNVDKYKNYILKLPYAFYYLMISSKTTNFYELPYSGNYILQSDSSSGWQSRGLQNVTVNNDTTFGKVINYFTKNISFNMTPTWDGNASNTPISFDVEFQLFNDTIDAAANNFSFIHTLIPGNNWFQYHIYSCPPNVFDIRINGINRFFMCTAKIDCTKLGVLRNPPKRFYDLININTEDEKITEIKIPDAYNIKITFTSLLPNNFNNYLFAMYSRNESMFVDTTSASLYGAFMTNFETALSNANIIREYSPPQQKQTQQNN